MKLFEIPMVVTSMLGFCLLWGVDVPAARADFTFGPPVNLGPTINTVGARSPSPSADGLELYFTHDKLAGNKWLGGEIYVARRATVDSEWGVPVSLGEPVNATTPNMLYAANWLPSISADGLSLYFTHDAGKAGRLYVAKRATTHDNWGVPVSVGAAVNTASAWEPCISADELELYFHSDRPGGYGQSDLWVTTRATVNDDWGAPVNLGPAINSPAWDDGSGISPDGLLLFFSSDRAGGSGNFDTYVARRATKKDPWGLPVNLGPTVNSASVEAGPRVSFDGSMVYFESNRPGGYAPSTLLTDSWQAPIIPIVDFNGDGKVDAKDLALLVANWGKSNSVCDIGPFAWGDGIVDERDLKVLMESLMTPGPKASDVLCDVILSWIAPSFANTCDVYLGTSLEAVSTADRANPKSVLVSQGQTAATYDPPGLLEFSRTYYWRVDFVIPGSTPAIYQGPVLKFTTAALVYPIKNITAKASSMQAGSGPERTVDGSGLDKNDGHSTDPKDMWWSQGVSPNWIQYEFDKVYTLHELWVWNSNQIIEPFMGFGAKSVKIEYSTGGATWTPLAGVPDFARAPGQPGYPHNTTVSFGGVPAKHVKLTIEKNWGVTPQTGLSEVRFFCTQSAAATKP